MKFTLFTLFLLFQISLNVCALSTSGSIELTGVIPGYHTISTETYLTSEATFTDLGQAEQIRVVGKINLFSNVLNGFKMTLSSDNQGNFVLNEGDINEPSHHVGYRLWLINRTGDFGNGITLPTGFAAINLNTPKEFAFTGVNVGASSVSYELRIKSFAKSNLTAGNYADAITVTISDN